MTNNYSSQNDEFLAKNTNSEKPVSLYLSETESRRDEEEINAVIEELLKIIHPQKERSSKKISFRSMIVSFWLAIALLTRWQKFLLGNALFWNALFILLLANYQLTIFWAVSTIVALTLWIIFYVSFIVVYMVLKWQSPRENTKRRLNQIKSDYIADKEKVGLLREFVPHKKLKLFEIEIESLLREAQTREKISFSLSAILSIIAILFFLLFLDVRVESLENNLLKGITGVVTLVTQLLNFMIALIFKSEIDGINKCLAILKKAQISTDDVESYKKIALSKESGKKQSFMSKAKNISIDGPADFSVNHENR